KGIPSLYFQQWNSPSIKIDLLLKGGGSENIGRTYSLPNEELNAERNLDGVRKCVLDAVVKAQGMGCPPSIISVVVGGSKDAIAIESKKLFLEKLSKKNKNPKLALFEKKLLEEINSTGIGPIGIGGSSTALALKTKFLSRHPATFFVEVAFSCWCDRRTSLEWKNGAAKYE
ncbi:fumarate hydratase, partial [Candidatus Micrarchaeota archaeon]|nr:fumarate hydratase [Candidatus Micrarchaeota archaeon]